jgi:excisionase family DNA binding protein
MANLDNSDQVLIGSESMLTKQETRKRLGNISISTLDRMMAAGMINYVRVGLRGVRFRQEDIEEYKLRNSALPQSKKKRMAA